MLGGLALALAFAVACVLLGRWQWSRYEDRRVQADAVTSHYSAVPVPIGSVTTRIPPSEEDQWLRVTAEGRYAPDQQLLVRNRALDGQPGLEVLVPFDLGGALTGTRIFVDRGWVANADSAADLPPVPPAPGGDVTVEGWLRSGEPDLGSSLRPASSASIDLGAAARQTGGGTVLDAYLVLGSEQPSGPGPNRSRPRHQPRPAPGLRVPVVADVAVRVRALGYRLRVDAEARREATSTVPKPKKVRIWDEEDG